jgi:hypothetical protein
VLLERNHLAFAYWAADLPYATSLVLLTASTLVANRSSWRFDFSSVLLGIATLLLLCLTHWVNLSAVLYAAPLFLGLAIVQRSRTYAALAILTVVAYALVTAHAGADHYAVLIPSMSNIIKAGNLLMLAMRPAPALLLILGGCLAFWYLLRQRYPVGPMVVILVAALMTFLVTANVEWVLLNLSLPRYLLLPVTGAIAVFAIAMVEAVWCVSAVAVPNGKALAKVIGIVAIVVVAFWATLPLNMSCRFYPGEPRTPERAATAEIAELAIKTEAMFIAGDYWTVWPAVFVAISKSGRQIYGVALRGEGARQPILRSLHTNPRPIILCIGQPLASCTARLNDVLGSPLNRRASVIGTGNLPGRAVPGVTAVLEH